MLNLFMTYFQVMFGLIPFPIVWSIQRPSSARRVNEKKSLPTNHNVYSSNEQTQKMKKEVQGLIKRLKASTTLISTDTF